MQDLLAVTELSNIAVHDFDRKKSVRSNRTRYNRELFMYQPTYLSIYLSIRILQCHPSSSERVTHMESNPLIRVSPYVVKLERQIDMLLFLV